MKPYLQLILTQLKIKLATFFLQLKIVLAANKAKTIITYLENKTKGYLLALAPLILSFLAVYTIQPDKYLSVTHLLLALFLSIIIVFVVIFGYHFMLYESYRQNTDSTWNSFKNKVLNSPMKSQRAREIADAIRTIEVCNSNEPTLKLGVILDLILHKEKEASKVCEDLRKTIETSQAGKNVKKILYESVQAKLQQSFLIAEAFKYHEEMNSIGRLFRFLIEWLYGSDVYTITNISIVNSEKKDSREKT